MLVVISQHLLNVFVQLANKRGFKTKQKKIGRADSIVVPYSVTRKNGVLSNKRFRFHSDNTTLGYGFHFEHRNPRTFPIDSFAHDSGRTLVRPEYGYPKGSPNKLTNYIWRWTLLKRPLDARPLDSLTAFHGTRRFNTEFTRAVHILSQTDPVHITLQIPTVKEEIRRNSSQYSARLSAHPNDLIVNLMEQPDNRQFRRHLPNDLPTRFLV
jgi:hypothetical protein